MTGTDAASEAAGSPRDSWRDVRAPVVVGIDGSANSRKALRFAVDATRAEGRPLRAVMVWQWLDQLDPRGAAPFRPEYDEANAKQALEAVIAEEVAPGDRARVEAVTVCGLPGPEMVEQARDAAYVVVGTRGLGPVKGWLLGSVSSDLVRHCAVPVVVVPARD